MASVSRPTERPIMTNPTPHGQVPEALRLAEQYDHGDPAAHGNAWKAAVCTELRRQHTRIAELESELEAVGAGGVSGPLVGRVPLSANAGEPVAWQYRSLPDVGGVWFECSKERAEQRAAHPDRWEVRPLYAAPPTAQADGWRPIAEHDGSACDVHLYCEDSREQFIGFPGPLVGAFQYCAFPGGTMSCRPSHWMPLPPPPTSAEGVEHG